MVNNIHLNRWGSKGMNCVPFHAYISKTTQDGADSAIETIMRTSTSYVPPSDEETACTVPNVLQPGLKSVANPHDNLSANFNVQNSLGELSGTECTLPPRPGVRSTPTQNIFPDFEAAMSIETAIRD